MTILVTGGTGKTGTALAKALQDSNHRFLLAGRSGSAPPPFAEKGVKFDWLDETTYDIPFKTDPSIDRVYIVTPLMEDASPVVKKFIDFAMKKGVKRFVWLSGTAMPKGVAHGQIHTYLEEIGTEFTVLRPTWFNENFGTMSIQSIRDANSIFSAMEDGRIPFVSVDDIAVVARDALVRENSANTAITIIGPTLYTYDEVANLLSEILGRKITHVRTSVEKLIESSVAHGFPKGLATIIFPHQEKIANGAEEALVGKKQTITGKCELKDYLVANKALWMPVV